jgi:hypothetical protein
MRKMTQKNCGAKKAKKSENQKKKKKKATSREHDNLKAQNNQPLTSIKSG